MEANEASTLRKKSWDRKRHLLVDTAGISDREGTTVLLGNLQRGFPRVSHLFADHGYAGPLREWIKEHLYWKTEIVPNETNDSRQNWVLINRQSVLNPNPKADFRCNDDAGSWNALCLAFAFPAARSRL